MLSPPPALESRLVNLDSAAALHSVSRRTLERAVKAGRLSVVKVGRRTLVRPDDVTALLTGSAPVPSARSDSPAD